MFELDECMKIDNEVEVTTTWGFPESVDPESVIFLGENDFALTLESEARTKKYVLCKVKQHKGVYTLGNLLDDECFAKIERFYPKPDYKDIIVQESGNTKKGNQSNSNSKSVHNSGDTKKGNQSSLNYKSVQESGATKKGNQSNFNSKSGTGSTAKKIEKQNQDEDAQSVTSSCSEISKVTKPSNSSYSISPVGSKSSINSPSSAGIVKPKQEPLEYPTTYQDLGLTDHTGAYPCIYCTRTFMTMNELKLHCASEHMSNKPFRCKVCSKCFRNSRQLLLHTFTHTGEKHYSCLYCAQMFRQPGHRNNHMKISHGDSLPYKCDQESCTLAFQTSLELTRHTKENHIVRKTKCRHCKINFENPNQLREHECPKKEKKLNCGACGERFHKMADVLNHAKYCKYVDAAEVTCEKCGTRFPSAAKCSVHKTYLCTGEPIPQKDEKMDDLLDKVKQEMVDYDEVTDMQPGFIDLQSVQNEENSMNNAEK